MKDIREKEIVEIEFTKMTTENMYADINEINSNIKKWGYRCLDDKYKNAKTKLNLIDKDGYKYYVTYDSLKSTGGGSDFVSKYNKYSIENIRLWLIKKDLPYELLSDVFEKNNKKLKFHCNKHNIDFEINWNNIKFGQHCYLCGEEIRLKKSEAYKLNIDIASDRVSKKIPTVKVIDDKWINSQSKIKCKCSICENEFLAWYGNLMKGEGCPVCGLRKGEDHGSWKGGITPLYNNMRTKMLSWKLDSYDKYNHKCDITGKKLRSNVIHHLYNYSTILQETLDELGYKTKGTLTNYTEKELKQIEDKCLELHYKHGLGVCLSEEIHKEFHKIYGQKNNSLEQYLEFKNNKLKELNNEKEKLQ